MSALVAQEVLPGKEGLCGLHGGPHGALLSASEHGKHGKNRKIAMVVYCTQPQHQQLLQQQQDQPQKDTRAAAAAAASVAAANVSAAAAAAATAAAAAAAKRAAAIDH